MPRYTSQLNHNGLGAGDVVDIPDEEVEQWAGEIEAGFLVPVYEPPEIEDSYVTPSPFESGPVVEVTAEPEPDA